MAFRVDFNSIMTLRTFSILALVHVASMVATAQKNTSNANWGYKNSKLSTNARVTDLLSRMTLEEKAAQVLCVWGDKKLILDSSGRFLPEKAKQLYSHGMGQIGRPSEGMEGGGGLGRTPKENAVITNEIQRFFVEQTRLGIPVLFHEEGLHGHMARFGTSFPQPIAMASSWNPALAETLFGMTAKEMRARGGHVAYTPVIDIARDPRWGRVEETYGEDPYLVAQMGLAAVRGFQGRTGQVDSNHVWATLKHFAGHGHPEGGNNISPSVATEHDFRENHLYPFKVAVQQGHAGSVMASYNEVNGVPSHANRWLLQDVLRKEWGFNGVVVSDYYGVEELHLRHKVAESLEQAGILALKSGVDLETPDAKSFASLAKAVKDGKVPMVTLDSAVSRTLRQKFDLGLFEKPYVSVDNVANKVATPENAVLARKAAEESIVLLKNNKQVLPLQVKQGLTIAVIGPNANEALQGGYSDQPQHVVTVLEGLKQKLGNQVNILYSEGCKITYPGSWFKDEVKLVPLEENLPRIQQAVDVAQKADLIILALGDNELVSREGWSETHLGDRSDLQLLAPQDELINRIAALNKPTISLLFNGKPLAVNNLLQKSDALLECWYLGQEAGNALANVLVGEINPSGKLPITFPRSVGHIPCYYNHKPTARRGYQFDDVSPLFHFGYGLSYTTFQLQGLAVDKKEVKRGESAEVSITVTNTGQVAGQEVVQLYIRDCYSSVTRPVKELKGFKKISLKAGESTQVRFTITPEMRSFYNQEMKFVEEPGEFEVFVGNSSRKEDLQSIRFNLK